MIPRICPVGDHQTVGKPVTLYWAWNLANGARRAYRQAVCTDCFRDAYALLIVRGEEPVLACPSCGIATVDDYDAVYVTYFYPGSPKGRSDLPMCNKCAAELRIKAMKGAAQLDDRGSLGSGASAPEQDSSGTDWRQQLGTAR